MSASFALSSPRAGGKKAGLKTATFAPNRECHDDKPNTAKSCRIKVKPGVEQ